MNESGLLEDVVDGAADLADIAADLLGEATGSRRRGRLLLILLIVGAVVVVMKRRKQEDHAS